MSTEEPTATDSNTPETLSELERRAQIAQAIRRRLRQQLEEQQAEQTEPTQQEPPQRPSYRRPPRGSEKPTGRGVTYTGAPY